jgi:aryl-alcohol dehydrogenase-like predicted oxidoreductase
VRRLQEIATRKGCTAAQLALAWLVSHPEVVPIPGSTRRSRVEENSKAVDVELTAGDIAEIEEVAPKGIAAGTRYPPAGMAALNR